MSTNSRSHLAIFYEFLSKDQKKGLRHQSFSSVLASEFYRAINSNLGDLGLELHFSSPEPVNFFWAQSSLVGLGAGMPPRGAGPGFLSLRVTLFVKQRKSKMLKIKNNLI